MLPEMLERRLGAKFMNEQNRTELQKAMSQCPPVDPRLIHHLRLMFQDPTDKAKATNPMLGQLLTIQFGVDKVLNYLQKQYDAQSAAARQEREI